MVEGPYATKVGNRGPGDHDVGREYSVGPWELVAAWEKYGIRVGLAALGEL